MIKYVLLNIRFDLISPYNVRNLFQNFKTIKTGFLNFSFVYECSSCENVQLYGIAFYQELSSKFWIYWYSTKSILDFSRKIKIKK